MIGLILGLAGASVYAAVSRSLLDEVDRNLLTRSDEALPILFPGRRVDLPSSGGQSGAPSSPGFGGPGRRPCEGYSGGIFCVALGPDASVRANPQDVTTSDLPWPDSY